MIVSEIRRAQAEYDSHLDRLNLDDPEAIREEVGKLSWWQSIDLGGGIVTPGRGSSEDRLRNIHFPDLRGKTVLDVGAWDGLFSFEAEKRGAQSVVALDLARPPTFELARRALRSRVVYLEMDVARADPADVGVYDVVFLLGVIYHVPSPFDLIHRVSRMTRELLILETATGRNWAKAPVAEFRGKREALEDENYGPNWWIPNAACVEAMLTAAGFDHVHCVWGPEPPRSRLQQLVRAALPRLGFKSGPNRLIVHAKKRS